VVAVSLTGEANIGLPRLAAAVDDAADDRDGQAKHNFIKGTILAIHEALSGNSDQAL